MAAVVAGAQAGGAAPTADTPLVAAIRAPVPQSDINCPDSSTHARGYADALVLECPRADLAHVPAYVRAQLAQAQDQSDPCVRGKVL